MKTCWNCGDSIPDAAAVCETCGAEQNTAASSGESPVKVGGILAGRYEIRGEIGEGAVGRVYRAQDKDVDVAVALRVVHPEWVADEAARKQFKAAFRKSRDILHAGCVKLYEADVEGGVAFLTMEFVGGLSLRRVLAVRLNERRPFKPSEVEPILSQLSAALGVGHSKNVTHLSLSPGNILIQPEGLKLTDFGLASLIPPDKRRAAADKYKTVVYASPQYLAGEASSPADDIYSLGAVLFEMVTLQTPAPGLTPRDVLEDVPEDIDDLIADCLSEKPSKRPKSAAEVLARWQEAVAKEAAREEAAKAAKAAPPPPPKPAPAEAAPPPPPPPPPSPPPKEEPVQPKPAAAAPAAPTAAPEEWPETPAAVAPKAEPPKPPVPKAEPPKLAAPPAVSQPAAEAWTPPPAKKGPPVAIILAVVVVLAGVGGYFALGGGGSDKEKPVSVATKETGKPAASLEGAKPSEPEKPEPDRAEAVKRAAEEKPTAVSISKPPEKEAPKETEKEAPAPKPAKETRPAESPKAVAAPVPEKAEPPAKPAKEEKAPKEDKAKKVAAAETPVPSGNCPAGMAFVPGGNFKMGSASDDSARDFAEKTLTPTGVPDFCIDKYESPNTDGAQPRASVTWSEAKATCEGQGKRLCSEAEWEKACKGPKETRYPYGDLFNARSCNTRDASGSDRTLAPAGKFSQCTNGYGVFDMSGNLREWTSTAWSESSGDRVVRGGSHSRPDWATRCAFRENFQPGTKDSQIGFRCCK